MSTPIHIIDGRGTKQRVMVTSLGQLVTAPISYDEVKTISLNVDDAGFTFYKPKAGEQFVVTAILLTADKNVTTDCIVEIYESAAEDSNVVSGSVLSLEMLKNTGRDITGLNFVASEGVYINGKTDDNNVSVTIMGYYITKL